MGPLGLECGVAPLLLSSPFLRSCPSLRQLTVKAVDDKISYWIWKLFAGWSLTLWFLLLGSLFH